MCKLFDIFTPFSIGLVYLMYRCFNEVAIHKPITSRPANSERLVMGETFHFLKLDSNSLSIYSSMVGVFSIKKENLFETIENSFLLGVKFLN